MKVTHVITSLHVGGAEMMLLKLLSGLGGSGCQSHVISLIDGGPVAEQIRALGIPVESAGLRRSVPGPGGMARLASLLRRSKPDVVQTWLYHGDLLGSLAAKLGRLPAPLVWNIRHSELHRDVEKRTTLWTAQLCARLSWRLPRRVIVNSSAGRGVHEQLGYDPSKLVLVPNGFEIERFRPDAEARGSVRNELGLAADAPLVGLVARYHPQKDHRTFVHSARLVLQKRPEAHFLLCGSEVNWENVELRQMVEETGFCNRFHLLGRRDDLPRLHAALDLGVLSSASEGFPNVIGEAMSCGVPCVVTAVGGSGEVVGDTGRVVPCRDPQAQAAACLDMLALPADERATLGRRARQRIEQHFSLPRIVERYLEIWHEAFETNHAQSRRAA